MFSTDELLRDTKSIEKALGVRFEYDMTRMSYLLQKYFVSNTGERYYLSRCIPRKELLMLRGGAGAVLARLESEVAMMDRERDELSETINRLAILRLWAREFDQDYVAGVVWVGSSARVFLVDDDRTRHFFSMTRSEIEDADRETFVGRIQTLIDEIPLSNLVEL